MQTLKTRKRTAHRRGLGSRMARSLAAALTLVFLTAAVPAAAESYSVKRSGHPLRIIAYVVHPIGVIIETLVFRPVHWIAHHEPLKTLFGQKH